MLIILITTAKAGKELLVVPPVAPDHLLVRDKEYLQPFAQAERLLLLCTYTNYGLFGSILASKFEPSCEP